MSPYIPLVILLIFCLVYGAPIWVWTISIIFGYIISLILIFILGVSGAGYSMTVDQVALKFVKDIYRDIFKR